jgi:signal transduction histidine kinase
LSQQVFAVQEEERTRISRELHDEIAQALTAVHVHLSALESEASVDHVALKKRISKTQRLVEKSVKTVYHFASQLRPALLDDLGLVPALRSHIKAFAKRTGIQVHYTLSPKVEELSNVKRTVIYRVAQEALTNVARRSATRVTLSVCASKDIVRMEIADNGKSSDATRALARKSTEGFGLLGMQERVQMVGGRFTIHSESREGKILRAEIPFDDEILH